jgi:hypothetical protein
MGLNEKPSANMNNYQNININEIDLDLIDYNVRTFKKINNL